MIIFWSARLIYAALCTACGLCVLWSGGSIDKSIFLCEFLASLSRNMVKICLFFFLVKICFFCLFFFELSKTVTIEKKMNVVSVLQVSYAHSYEVWKSPPCMTFFLCSVGFLPWYTSLVSPIIHIYICFKQMICSIQILESYLATSLAHRQKMSLMPRVSQYC